MTSFLEVDAADDRNSRLASRKAVVVAQARARQQFDNFITSPERLKFASEDIAEIARVAADEHGQDDKPIYDSVMDYFSNRLKEWETEGGVWSGDPSRDPRRTAAVHESRKPKMCPFHRDVVDISLTEGSAKAGFDAMAQHWGGPRHCDGEGYEGDKCNFKPQMVTQSYWDEKAEKAEERKQQRAEQAAELEAQQGDEINEPVAEGDTIIEEPSATETIETEPQGAEVIDFPAGEATEAPAGEEIPMSMAASAKTADDTTGLGGPLPTIDKRKWTPQTVPFLDVDDKDGRNPTRHKDIVETIKPVNADKLEEIGEQVTEHIDLDGTESDAAGYDDGGVTTGGPTKTWTTGPATAVSSVTDDIHTNPITELVREGYDGFLPEATVQQAIAAVRK